MKVRYSFIKKLTVVAVETLSKLGRSRRNSAVITAAIRQLEEELSVTTPGGKKRGKSMVLHQRVSRELLADLKTLAKKLNMTTSELTRRILQQFINSMLLTENKK